MKAIFPSIILLTGALLMAGIGTQTSLNRTEVAHFGAAAYFWQTGKTDLFHVNPPLGRIISGVPIVLSRPDYDWAGYSQRPQDRSEWNVGMAFIRANPPEKIREMYILGRWVLIPLIFLGGWFGYRLASEIYGYSTGVIFAILWSFSPLFLGWGATLCPDMLATSLGVIAFSRFRAWFMNATWKNTIIAGLCIGLLPLAKLTWVIAFLLFPFLWLVTVKRPPLTQLLVALLIALYILNMGYLFDGSFQPLKEYTFISQTLRGSGTEENLNRFADSPLGYVPVPLPKEFVLGIDTQKRDFENGLESYLLGKHSGRGWWYYYFVVLALKEPLGTLLLFGTAVFLAIRKKEYRSNRNDELLVFVPFLVLFALISLQTGISNHPRYLLPAMPFFYLFTSRVGKVFESKKIQPSVSVSALLVWTVLGSLFVYPYSMSYFNEIVPLKKRPYYLLGSNIDWGQDAYFLKSWLQKHPEASPIRVTYPCPETIERIGIDSAGRPPFEPENGWFALGVNDLFEASQQYRWLQKEEPVAIVGYSIYIFHISGLPENRETANE